MTDMTLTLMGSCGTSMVFAIAGILGSITFFDKYKKMKRRYELQSENYEFIKKKYAEQERHIKDMARDYDHLLKSGCLNLKWTEKVIPYTEETPQKGVIAVVGQDTRRSDLSFAVKSFMFDPDDPSDREFAIRRAEELIEIIQTI